MRLEYFIAKMITQSLSEMAFWLFVICLLCIALLEFSYEKTGASPRFRRRFFRKFISLWIGISLTLLYNLSPTPPPRSRLQQQIQAELDIKLKDLSRDEKRPVIFITTTDYSSVQVALLTKTAQALYPSRDQVFWVVVSLPIRSSPGYSDIFTLNSEYNYTFSQAIIENPELVRHRMKYLDGVLKRFGIPYVLLNSNKMVNFDFGWETNIDRTSRGIQVGLAWAIKFLPKGVILVGDEHYTFDSRLFYELFSTKTAAVWNIGPPKPDPLLSIFPYDNYTGSDIPFTLTRGGFALDIEYLRDKISPKDHWKVILDKDRLMEDFNLTPEQVQHIKLKPLPGNQTQYFVWTTTTYLPPWPKRIVVPSNIYKFFNGTTNNIVSLLKNIFGPRYYLKQDLISLGNSTNNMTYLKDKQIEMAVKGLRKV